MKRRDQRWDVDSAVTVSLCEIIYYRTGLCTEREARCFDSFFDEKLGENINMHSAVFHCYFV